jgi:hemoglobin
MTTKTTMKFDQANLRRRLLRTLAVSLLLSLYIPQAQAQKQDNQRGVGLRRAEQVNTLPEKSKRYALVIGVDKYADGSITPLDGASNDAKALADALIRYAGFPKDQVILLASDQPPERRPTRGEILLRLSNLRGAAPKDGLLLVAFAGHGVERNGQAYLLPSDARIHGDMELLQETSINVTRMKDAIRAVGVGQVVLLLDACRNDPSSGRSDSVNPLTGAYTRGFNFDVRNREVTAFATLYATEVGQRAYEYNEKRQGYFTWALVEGLQGAAANDRGEVTLSGLIRYVQEAVPKRVQLDLGRGASQKPLAVVEGYRADELVIAAPGKRATDNSPDAEIAYWNSIKDSSDPANFSAYLDDYPQGRFRRLAENRLRELEAPGVRPSASGPEPARPNSSIPAPPLVTGSLYQRLGGKDAISAIVEDLARNILSDSRINNKYAKIDAPHPLANLKDFFCDATGGPCRYSLSKEMALLGGRRPTESESKALIESLIKTLFKFGLQEKERLDLIDAIGGTLDVIIERESFAAGTGSLYERLGGKDAISRIVEDMAQNILMDSRINRKFAKSDAPRLLAKLKDFFCAATGGPCRYSGLNMKKAHKNMGTTAGEFNAMMEDMVMTLNKFGVHRTEQTELLSALGGMRGDIVESESAATGGDLPGKFKPAPPIR